MGNQFNNTIAVFACFKSLLFILNSVFWCFGAVLMIAGIWLLFESHRYVELSPEFSGTAPHLFIGTSWLIIAVSSVAFSIIFKAHSALLYTYSAFLVCIFIMELGAAASVVCYQDTFAKSLHDGLTNSLLNYNPQKSNIGLAQSTLQCCGVSNYTDWVRLSSQRVIPPTCCFNPNRCVTANYSDVYHRGCYEAIIEFLEKNKSMLIGVVVACGLLPLLLASLSCCLGHYAKKTKCRPR